jgi:DNA-binding CsgD family transcriptional regulator/biotin operon repressor
MVKTHDIGLRRDADVVYRTMLRKSSWTLEALAQALDWGETDVRAQIDQLQAEGLVLTSADEPLAYRAVEPELALPAMAARWFGNPDRKAMRAKLGGIHELISLRDRLAERSAEPRKLRGMDELAMVAERLVSKVRDQVTILAPSHVLGEIGFMPHLAEAVFRRQAQLRPIWATDIATVPCVATYGRWLRSNSAAPRMVARVPFRAIIVDSSVAIVFDGQENAHVEYDERAVARLCGVADHLWNEGVEGRQQVSAPTELHGAERAEHVLYLLSKGLTDEAVARRLGVSVRTIRNDVSSAMNVLEARSRFQAGANAARLGLL